MNRISIRRLIRSLSYTGVLAVPGLVHGQTPLPPTPPDTIKAIVELHAMVERHGAAIGPLIWPGFRPDTVPALYVIPNRGKVLLSWRREQPRGMMAWPTRTDVHWTDTRPVGFPSGSGIAFNNLFTMNRIEALGLAVHEAFHSFERSMVRPGARFGTWENALVTSRYPVFDLENETAFALESRLLRRALSADADSTARRLARDFLAVRTRRHSALTQATAEYEASAEINEGLAQYALLRGGELLAARGAIPTADARAEVERETELLDRILAVDTRSVRRRFYATGSALARLLDRFAGDSWKHRLMVDTVSLQRVLAEVVRFQPGEAQLLAERAGREENSTQLRANAEPVVNQLRTQRAAQVDSVLARPGLRVAIDPAALQDPSWNWCGFDPQNLLQTGTGKLLHTSFLNACSGSDVRVEIQGAVVQDQQSNVLELVIDPAAVRVTSADTRVDLPSARRELPAFKLESPTLTITAPRAIVWRDGNLLRIQPAR